MGVTEKLARSNNTSPRRHGVLLDMVITRAPERTPDQPCVDCLDRLDEAECLRLLGIRGLGRLVYNSRYGPMALPVEYHHLDTEAERRSSAPEWSRGSRANPSTPSG